MDQHKKTTAPTRVWSIAAAIALLLTFASCQKFLDEKSNRNDVVPASLKDMQALLDYYIYMNNQDAGAGEVSADNYYLTPATYAALSSDYYKRMYTWEKANLFQPGSNDWFLVYRALAFANTALEGVGEMERTAANAPEWDNVKGQALFHRARIFHRVAEIWSPAWDSATAATDLGIPLRLSADFNEPSVRSSVQQTYALIVSDLKEAIPLLPATQVHVMRPSRAAAYALLARTFLSMRNYAGAGRYADSCLQLYNILLNYNSINASAASPFTQFNPEVVFESRVFTTGTLSIGTACIDSNLYASYAVNDIRKTAFFKSNGDGSYTFKGTYEGNAALFSGITTSEMWLTRAECYARAGNTTAAMNDLNTLLSNRWKTGTFTPLTATSAADALDKILVERRKELVFRMLRWMDIKRLNKEGAGIVLKRVIGSNTYTLPPNDPRYALPIPEDIIVLTGMPQNP